MNINRLSPSWVSLPSPRVSVLCLLLLDLVITMHYKIFQSNVAFVLHCFLSISTPLYRHIQTVALLFCNEFNCARFTRNSGEKDSGDHLIQSLMTAHALIPESNK